MRFWLLLAYILTLELFAGIVFAYWLAHLLPILETIDNVF